MMLLMRTKDVAELCLIRPTTITTWVQNDTLVPARKGMPTRGQSHCFSARQVTALVLIGIFHNHVGQVCPHFIDKVMTWFENMTDAQLAHYLFDDAEGSLGPKPSWWKTGGEHLNFHLYEHFNKRMKETNPIIITYFGLKRCKEVSAPTPAHVSREKAPV
jgi:hypothetical protein